MGKLDGRVAFITVGARCRGRSHRPTLAGEGASVPFQTYPGGSPEEFEQTQKIAEFGGSDIAGSNVGVALELQLMLGGTRFDRLNRKGEVMLNAQGISDYIEICTLSARYNHLADSGDGEAYADLFTEDGYFDVVGNRVYRGRKELAACASTAASKTVHVTANPIIEIDGDTATQRTRLISCLRTADGTRNEFVNTGYYIDELRRTPAGWRFVSRRAECDLNAPELLARLGVSEALAQIG